MTFCGQLGRDRRGQTGEARTVEGWVCFDRPPRAKNLRPLQTPHPPIHFTRSIIHQSTRSQQTTHHPRSQLRNHQLVPPAPPPRRLASTRSTMVSSSGSTYNPDPSSLSSLSTQLLSLNLITKPLDLVPIFSPPSQAPLSPSQLAADSRAREALLRCLWAMLAARHEMGDALEKVDGIGRVREYELERAEAIVAVEKRKSAAAEKDAQAERARAK